MLPPLCSACKAFRRSRHSRVPKLLKFRQKPRVLKQVWLLLTSTTGPSKQKQKALARTTLNALHLNIHRSLPCDHVARKPGQHGRRGRRKDLGGQHLTMPRCADTTLSNHGRSTQDPTKTRTRFSRGPEEPTLPALAADVIGTEAPLIGTYKHFQRHNGSARQQYQQPGVHPGALSRQPQGPKPTQFQAPSSSKVAF